MELSPDLLRALLRYEPRTGKLYWRTRSESMFSSASACKAWNSRFAGKEALTCINTKGYRSGTILGKTGYLAHRVAWAVHFGKWPSHTVDHKDGDILNNRLRNFRSATRQQNQRNQKMPNTNSSGRIGVTWSSHARKWRAFIGTGQRSKKHLGYFTNFSDAVEARVEAERDLAYHANHGR